MGGHPSPHFYKASHVPGSIAIFYRKYQGGGVTRHSSVWNESIRMLEFSLKTFTTQGDRIGDVKCLGKLLNRIISVCTWCYSIIVYFLEFINASNTLSIFRGKAPSPLVCRNFTRNSYTASICAFITIHIGQLLLRMQIR